MVAKKRLGAKAQEALKHKGTFRVDGETEVIPMAIIGQLEPLDRVAREKQAKWGDTLPSLVAPELAGRFRAAYDALDDAVTAKDVMAVNKIAGQLMRAWDVIERAAMDAGHLPPVAAGYAVDVEGVIVAFAISGVEEMRKQHPDWVVYPVEDAARLLRHQHNVVFSEVYNAFPNARVVDVRQHGALEEVLDDEIPF